MFLQWAIHLVIINCIHFFSNYRRRTGFVPILSLKVALCVMCSEKVQEKYTCRCTQFTVLEQQQQQQQQHLFIPQKKDKVIH